MDRVPHRTGLHSSGGKLCANEVAHRVGLSLAQEMEDLESGTTTGLVGRPIGRKPGQSLARTLLVRLERPVRLVPWEGPREVT